MNEIIKVQQTQDSIAASRNYQESLEAWKGNTGYGKIAFLISSNMGNISKFAEIVGKLVGEKAVENMRDKQYFNPVYGEFKNFLSRNIYLSRAEREKMERERYAVGYASSLVTESGIKLLSCAVGQWANNRNKFLTLLEVYSFLNSYASQNIKNCNYEGANIELAKIRSSFPLSTRQKIKLNNKVAGSNESICDIIGKASFMSSDNNDLRISISYLLYSVHCQMFAEFSDDTEALKYLINYYNALGFRGGYAEELLRENHETYQKITDVQSKYLGIARSFIKNTFVEIPNIDIDRLKSQAENMAKYDPYSFRRKKVQNSAKSGAATIIGVYKKDPALIIQGAATAVSQLDLESDVNTIDLIANLLIDKGIEKNDVDAILESSDCISSLASKNNKCDKSEDLQ